MPELRNPHLRNPHHWWSVALAVLPFFTGVDLLGQEHTSREYEGKRTLLVAITDKHAGDGLRQWFVTADSQVPGDVQREAIISLHLPFFVGIGAVRGRVKPQVPRQYWDATLLDRDGSLADTLGLSSSEEPYVFALDEHGRVLASVHGPADSPDAARIWSSLSNPEQTNTTSPSTPATSSQGDVHTPGNK